MKAKVLLLLVLLCAVAQGAWAQNYDVWDGVTMTKPEEDNYHVIHIKKASELAYIRDNYDKEEWGEYTVYTNIGSYKEYKEPYKMSISLEADIDMGDKVSWIPLGWTGSSENHYEGTFYGNSHTIRIHTTGATANYQGLFSGIHSDGKVENLHVVADIHCSRSRLVGGIAGENDGTIVNCWVSGTVRSDWHESSSAYTGKVGGICGENNGTVEFCCVTADVQNDDADVGGLVGCNDGTLKHCTFYGSVISSHSQDSKYVGDDGTESDLFDTFNLSEYNAASGYDLYRKAIRYTYDVIVNTEGNGTVQTYAAGENDVPGTRVGETFTLRVLSGNVISCTVTDADGNDVSLQGHANDWSSFWFVMPKKNVTATIVFDYTDWPRQGAGTEDDPYIISSAADWNDFAHNVKLGRPYSGNYVKLTSDISVTTMAGGYQADDNYHPFSGTFDGDGHTLTLNVSHQSRFAAPFKCVSGATIKDLKVAGNISSSHKYASGLVGFADGTNLIENCIVTATLNISSDYAGGIIGHGRTSTTTIRGCVFAGTINGVGSSRDNIGGIWGWRDNATPTLENCLEAGTYTNIASMHPMGLQSNSGTSTNCYYLNPQVGEPRNACTVSGAKQAYAFTTAPTNLGELVKDYGTIKVYQNGILVGGTYYVAPATVTLADNADNNTAISNANGFIADVTLAGRTLYKDGAWNTLCLPFDVTLSGSPLAGATARPLTEASISGTTLNLTFGDAVATLEAGTPYIIKWTSGDNIVSPVFSGVTIDATDRSYDNEASGDQRVRFLGTYKSTSFDAEDKSILFMGEGNKLYYPESGASIGAQRAYFKIGDGALNAPARQLTAFRINFGEDEATGIIEVKEVREVSGVKDDSWYSLDGRRLSQKPSRAGVYIYNGVKVAIK